MNRDETIEYLHVGGGQTVDLNGHTLTVKNQTTQTAGDIYVESGILTTKHYQKSYGNLYLGDGVLDNGYDGGTMVVGDLPDGQDISHFSFSAGDVHMEGGTLHVLSYIQHSGGLMALEGGFLNVAGVEGYDGYGSEKYGCYYMQQDGGITGQAKLQMTDPNDRVVIKGDMLVDTMQDNALTNGFMSIYGNFKQINGNGTKYDNFVASGNHMTYILHDGITANEINFDTNSQSKFNVLLLNKKKVDYTILQDPNGVYWNYLIEEYNGVITKSKFGKEGVDSGTGNFSRSYLDMELKSAADFDIQLGRTYNSLDTVGGMLGKGWRFSFEGKIQDSQNGTNAKEVILPDGSHHFFSYTNGTYKGTSTRLILEDRGGAVDSDTGLATQYEVINKKEKISYGFDSTGKLIWIKDRNGNDVKIEYHVDGSIDRIVDYADRILEFSKTVLQNGETDIIIFDKVNGTTVRNVQYRLNTNNQLVQVTDPSQTQTNYAYNANGLLEYVYDHNMNMIEHIQYADANGKVDLVTDRQGKTYDYVYEPNGKKETTRIDILFENAVQASIEQGFDSMKNVKREVDAEGNITKLLKNEYGEVVWSVKNVTEDENGSILQGNKTSYVYDKYGNITKKTLADGSTQEYTYVYDSVHPFKDGTVKTYKDENGRFTFYQCDDRGNIIEEAKPLDGVMDYFSPTKNPDYFSINTYDYYTESEMVTKLPGVTAKGLLEKIVHPDNTETNFLDYTVDGSIKTFQEPDDALIPGENKIIYSYTGNQLRLNSGEQSPKGYLKEFDYDLNGRVVRTTQSSNGVDIANQIDTVERESTQRTVYDAMGRKAQEIPPELYDPAEDDLVNHTYANPNKGYRYSYDPVTGNIDHVIDPEDVKTIYTYDPYGNVETRKQERLGTALEGENIGGTYQYTYDKIQRLDQVSFINTDGTQVLLEDRDYSFEKGTAPVNGVIPVYQVETVKRYTEVGASHQTKYVYDHAGRLIRQENPDGSIISKAYYPNGRVKSVTVRRHFAFGMNNTLFSAK